MSRFYKTEWWWEFHEEMATEINFIDTSIYVAKCNLGKVNLGNAGQQFPQLY